MMRNNFLKNSLIKNVVASLRKDFLLRLMDCRANARNDVRTFLAPDKSVLSYALSLMRVNVNRLILMGLISGMFSAHATLQDIFTYVCENKVWVMDGTESVSGTGSCLEETAVLRKMLPQLFLQLNIKKIIDAPCGDFYWMKHVDFGKCDYLGVDIVKQLVEENNKRYATATRKFLCANLVEEILPQADLIFCRDCLVHLSLQDCLTVLRNFKKSGARYLLTTSFFNVTHNRDTICPQWRTLNLTKAPFNFPEPLFILNEKCKYDGNKTSALWDLQKLIL